MKQITPKQAIVLEVLKGFIREKGVAPTLNELQQMLLVRGLGVSNKRGVTQFLESLERRGFITRTSEKRGIQLKEDDRSEFVTIPVLGYANAGRPLVFAEESRLGYLKASPRLAKGGQSLFALVIKGDSMNQCAVEGKNIEDGDFVVVDGRKKDPHDADVIVAVVDNCATVKTLRRISANEIALAPDSSNPEHHPIYVHPDDNFQVAGTVVNVFKNVTKES